MVRVSQADNTKTAFESFDHMSLKYSNAKRHALYQIGKLIYGKARKGIKEQPKTGEFYKYKGRKKQASAPGEYPANRSGNLRGKMGFKVLSPNHMIVGTEAEYGLFLEKGTRHMKARPFLSRPARESHDEVLAIMHKFLDLELKVKSHG